ncbi:MAG: efflux transporter outer membrane subunit [Curvibacter sp.]|nr:efflux transporter outer membrane subunit [Curvibacter sp.]
MPTQSTRSTETPARTPSLRGCRPALALLAAAALTACSVGPDYVRPAAPAGALSTSFKEAGDWKRAVPSQIDARSPWWQRFGDPALDELVAQANQANQSLAQAAAQYRQASALIQAAEAAGMPTLGLSSTSVHERSNTNGIYEGYAHNTSLQAAWEPDLWGRVSRSVEAAQAGAQASAADLAGARLSVQATVVNSYLQLRVDDALLALYARTVQGYDKALQLTRSQQRAGVASLSDVSLAEATLRSAQAAATDLQLARQQLEHAIAVLVGRTPSEFSVAAWPEDRAEQGLPVPPAVPGLLPSELLERRPDIAGAERRVAVANANIGIAESAWYPQLGLTASAGSSGVGLGNWFAAPYRIWAVGAQVAATLYDGGLRQSQDVQAQAAFEAAAANYRQVVLAGFQEVEDNLAAQRELAREREQLEAAAAAARRAEQVLMSQYRAGTATYLAVITAQSLTLGNQRAALQVRARQLGATVTLIKATGGGWTSQQD